MSGTDMSLAASLEHLKVVANASLSLWDIPADAKARLINVSENTTYLVEAPCGFKAVLRVHREAYHTRRAIECELAWLKALDQDKVITTPGVYAGRDGDVIQRAGAPGLKSPRFLVLFHFIEGAVPDESSDLTQGFEELGEIAARCHQHVVSWQKPANFQRLTWDIDAVFGAAPTWGNWRDAPGITPDNAALLEEVETCVRRRLTAFGQAADRFNLIHADMRLANLLVHDGSTRLIDFDDCGLGWFLYDFAAAISFIEDDPRVPELKSAWIRGYRSVRALSAAEELEIESFVMLRRMALLAWIGSHIEAPEPQALAPHFAENTAHLGRAYLARMSDTVA